MTALADRIVEHLKSGAHPAEIAERLDCSRGYISRVQQEKGTPKKKFLAHDRIQAAYLWGRGDYCVTEISQRLGVGKLRIIRFLTEEGLLEKDPLDA